MKGKEEGKRVNANIKEIVCSIWRSKDHRVLSAEEKPTELIKTYTRSFLRA